MCVYYRSTWAKTFPRGLFFSPKNLAFVKMICTCIGSYGWYRDYAKICPTDSSLAYLERVWGDSVDDYPSRASRVDLPNFVAVRKNFRECPQDVLKLLAEFVGDINVRGGRNIRKRVTICFSPSSLQKIK